LVKTEKVQVESNTGGVMILPAKEREEEWLKLTLPSMILV
jgi:hypothetical protein